MCLTYYFNPFFPLEILKNLWGCLLHTGFYALHWTVELSPFGFQFRNCISHLNNLVSFELLFPLYAFCDTFTNAIYPWFFLRLETKQMPRFFSFLAVNLFHKNTFVWSLHNATLFTVAFLHRHYSFPLCISFPSGAQFIKKRHTLLEVGVCLWGRC